VFLYGHLAWGHRIYFSDPSHVFKHLQQVQPTVLITVPRLLEKVYERTLQRSKRLQGFDQRIFHWALTLAQRFDVAMPPRGLYGLQLQLADRLVFQRWRSRFGGRLKACISGGSRLSAHLVRVFSAAGIPLLQGYGLTETSGVACYTRPAITGQARWASPFPVQTFASPPMGRC
jgi:long-chain acyl-CoA synthetase